MRVSIWKQERKGARWRRIGVVTLDMGGRLPWRRIIRHGDSLHKQEWPRFCWYALERDQYSLFN